MIYKHAAASLPMNCLVTGGAGFIGSHVVDALLAAHHHVVVIDNFSGGRKESLAHHILMDSSNSSAKPPVYSRDVQLRRNNDVPRYAQNKELVVYERSITEDMNELFTRHRFDCIFHLAALPSVSYSLEHPQETDAVNYQATLRLLDACARYHIPRFVFSSSCSVYGDAEQLPTVESLAPAPLSPYAEQKWKSEQACEKAYREKGIQAISLRYFNVYGPRQNPEGAYASVIPAFAVAFLEQRQPVMYGDGEQTRDFVYVSDIVEANLAALRTTNSAAFGSAVNIGTGEERAVHEIFMLLKDISGSRLQPLFREQRKEPRRACADISRARALLGWEPRASLREGLQKTFEWYREMRQ